MPPSKNASNELLELSKTYMDKLEAMLERVVQAAERLDKIHKEFGWKKFLLDLLKITSPIIIILCLLLSVHFMPCGTSLKLGSANISSAPCDVKN